MRPPTRCAAARADSLGAIISPCAVAAGGSTPSRRRGELGHQAQHVAHVGRAGWKDWNVVRYACDGDFILVTNNASDFRQLYAAQPLHAGLVILIPVVNRVVQQKLFRAALEELATIGEPINRVLEIDLDADNVTLALYDLPCEC
jgi:predicted nuclease of predicted toxin-antitoxin system